MVKILLMRLKEYSFMWNEELHGLGLGNESILILLEKIDLHQLLIVMKGLILSKNQINFNENENKLTFF